MPLWRGSGPQTFFGLYNNDAAFSFDETMWALDRSECNYPMLNISSKQSVATFFATELFQCIGVCIQTPCYTHVDAVMDRGNTEVIRLRLYHNKLLPLVPVFYKHAHFYKHTYWMI